MLRRSFIRKVSHFMPIWADFRHTVFFSQFSQDLVSVNNGGGPSTTLYITTDQIIRRTPLFIYPLASRSVPSTRNVGEGCMRPNVARPLSSSETIGM